MSKETGWPYSKPANSGTYTTSDVPVSVSGVLDVRRTKRLVGIVTNTGAVDEVTVTASVKIGSSSWATVFLSGAESPILPGETRFVQLQTLSLDYLEIHAYSSVGSTVSVTFALERAEH
jgi:hypothetical protein